MTLEQTISAVEEIINQHRVEIPDDLLKTISAKACNEKGSFGYFNGRTVIENDGEFRLIVYRVAHSDHHYYISFDSINGFERIVVDVDDIGEFCEKITDVQDIAIV